MKKRYGIIAGLMLAFSVISFTGIKAYEHHTVPCGQYAQKNGLAACYHQCGQRIAQQSTLVKKASQYRVYANKHHGEVYAEDGKSQYQMPCFDEHIYNHHQNAYTKDKKSQYQKPCFDEHTYDHHQNAYTKDGKSPHQQPCLKATGYHHQTQETGMGGHHRNGYHHHS